MNRLIKNEFKKIFHKKAIYVILLVTLLFMIAEKVIYKVFENQDVFYYEDDISFYEEQLKELDKNNEEDKVMYISLETNIEEVNLVKKYGNNSWQAYIIRNKGYEIIYNMKFAEGTEDYESAKTQYDKFINRLESNDWKVYAKEELDDINIAIKTLEETGDKNSVEIQNMKDTKQAIEWRIDKDISYAESNLNRYIEEWLQGRMRINDYNEITKTKVATYGDKY